MGLATSLLPCHQLELLRFAGLDAKRATRHVTFHVTSRDGISGPAAAASHASHVAFFPAAAARRSAKTCSYDSIYASHTHHDAVTRVYIPPLLSGVHAYTTDIIFGLRLLSSRRRVYFSTTMTIIERRSLLLLRVPPSSSFLIFFFSPLDIIGEEEGKVKKNFSMTNENRRYVVVVARPTSRAPGRRWCLGPNSVMTTTAQI